MDRKLNDIEQLMGEFSANIKREFDKLDTIARNSALSDEQKAALQKVRSGLTESIQNMDSEKIMETVTQFNNDINRKS